MFDRSLGMFQPSIGVIWTSPASLFARGEQGAWYDPSDFSTMFQNSAGTTPVTAIEQPVGRMLDKSGRGNHAFQSTTTSRPILRNLYNLLTYTEQFDNAAWTKIGTVVTPDTTQAPDGTVTADTLSENTGNQYHSVYEFTVVVSGSSNTFSCYLKKGTWRYAQLLIGNSSPFTTWIQCVIDLDTGLITQSSASATGTLVSANSEAVGDGWYRVSLTGVLSTATIQYQYVGTVTSATPTLNSAGVETRLGVVTRNIIIWGASFVSTNEASLPYQRVVTNTLGSGVYDTDLTKFKPYLFFDGSDDWLQTANINFSATDKMSVFAGVRKLSDATVNVIAELSATSANPGTFILSNYNDVGQVLDRYNYWAKGSIVGGGFAVTGGYAAPTTNVLTGINSISGDTSIIRVNGVLKSTATTDQGTGNFGAAYPLYIGRRGGTTLPFNGRLYSLIVRGTLTSSPQLEQTEAWVNSKTGAY